MVAVLLRAVLNVGKVKERLLEEEDIYEVVGRTMFTNPQFDKARKEATMELLQILGQLILENPSMRFSQILSNYGFVNSERVTISAGRGYEYETLVWTEEFYLEPVALLKRVQEKINDIKNSKG